MNGKTSKLMPVVVVVLLAVGATQVHAVPLNNTPVTIAQFQADFNVMNPVLQSNFLFDGGGGTVGVIGSQVFAGKGADAGIFAYLLPRFQRSSSEDAIE